ncbi:autotransporter assembly complex protein TamA [Vibrio sp. RC27]
MRLLLPSLAISLFLMSSSAYSDVDLTIKGVKGAEKENIDAYLSSIDEDDYSTSLRFRSRLKDEITLALNALGYYHPEISFRVEDDGQELVVNVDRGPATVIKSLDIQLDGEANTDNDFVQLIEESSLKIGSVINQGEYDSLKASIQSLAVNKGYFNGQFRQSSLAISPQLNQAFVTLDYDSGERFRYGEINIEGSQILESKVELLKSFDEGDKYLVSELGEFNQQLSNTGWFSTVLIQPNLDEAGENNVLPIDVTLLPAVKNKMEVGIGYSTDVGVRGSFIWNKPWLNEKGHSFSSNLSLSETEQTVTASYKIPLDNPIDEYYVIQYGLKNEDSSDTQSIESNLALKRFLHFDNGWNRTLSIRYLIENYEQGSLDDIAHFVLPGITFSRTRSRGTRLIHWGDKITATAEYGNEDFFSDTDILHLTGEGALIRTLSDTHRTIFRVAGGANLIDDFGEVPPSLRFYAGGDNSIRGYDYESISPTDSNGDVVGGKFLITSSVEYQYHVYGNWWGALFYDIGDAFDDMPDLKHGVGFGARWVSPIGPLRLDFAWGLDEEPSDQFHIHFTLGPEL